MKANYGTVMMVLMRSGAVATVFALLVRFGGMPWPSG